MIHLALESMLQKLGLVLMMKKGWGTLENIVGINLMLICETEPPEVGMWLPREAGELVNGHIRNQHAPKRAKHNHVVKMISNAGT